MAGNFAGVVQWQNTSFPSWIRGFDSLRPLHKYAGIASAILAYLIEALIGNRTREGVDVRWTSTVKGAVVAIDKNVNISDLSMKYSGARRHKQCFALRRFPSPAKNRIIIWVYPHFVPINNFDSTIRNVKIFQVIKKRTN